MAAGDDAQVAACRADQLRVAQAAAVHLVPGGPGRADEVLHVDEVQAPTQRK